VPHKRLDLSFFCKGDQGTDEERHSRGRLWSTFHSSKKEAAFFCGLLVHQGITKSNKPFYWQACEDAPTNESQNLVMGAPPAAPVAGIVIVCSVKTPLVTTPPFGTVIEG
jgi:hypothetical protein